MIVMLGHLKLDMEVSDADMETVESDDYRRMFRKDKDANSMCHKLHSACISTTSELIFTN